MKGVGVESLVVVDGRGDVLTWVIREGSTTIVGCISKRRVGAEIRFFTTHFLCRTRAQHAYQILLLRLDAHAQSSLSRRGSSQLCVLPCWCWFVGERVGTAAF